MPTLLFIDTNIFLDFYRVEGRPDDLKILHHIDKHHAQIITSSQVEMEFKKHRPGVILESFNKLSRDQLRVPHLPAYLSESKQASGVSTGRKRIDTQLEVLRKRIGRVFEKPTVFDPVYKVAQRLFRDDTPINLTRAKSIRVRVRRLATKRFALGYPPRKKGDTSIGDAVNWEWIVYCANANSADVVIVSRDDDYGLSLGKKRYMNDWLVHEFRDRVGRRRKILLTSRLAEGLEQAGISVARKEQQAEEAFLADRALATQDPGWATASLDAYEKFMKLVTALGRDRGFLERAVAISRAVEPVGVPSAEIRRQGDDLEKGPDS